MGKIFSYDSRKKLLLINFSINDIRQITGCLSIILACAKLCRNASIQGDRKSGQAVNISLFLQGGILCLVTLQ